MKIFGGKYLTTDELNKLGVASCGENVIIHETVQLIGLENIRIGSNVRIDAFSILSAASGLLKIGSHIHIGAYCYLSANASITLDDFSGLSQGVYIYSVSDDYSGASLTNPTIPKRLLKTKSAPVHLGCHVIVGAKTVVLPGASIGEGSAVGAMSLVNKPLPEWGIYAGVPAHRLRDRSKALLDDERRLHADGL